MKKFLILGIVALGVSGCKITEHDLFSFTKGEVIPLASGTYSCTQEKPSKHAEGGGVSSSTLNKLLRHATTFKDIIDVEEFRRENAVRYLVTDKNDPTSGSAYAFHSLGNGVFVYALPAPEGKGQVLQFVRLDGKKLEHIATRNHPDEAVVAKKHEIAQSTDVDYKELGMPIMKGTPQAEIAFLKELASDPKFFETFATCLPVSG